MSGRGLTPTPQARRRSSPGRARTPGRAHTLGRPRVPVTHPRMDQVVGLLLMIVEILRPRQARHVRLLIRISMIPCIGRTCQSWILLVLTLT